MIISAIEGSNKELKRTIKEVKKETRATIPRENIKTETFWRIAEEFQKKLAEMKNNETYEIQILKKIKFLPFIKDYESEWRREANIAETVRYLQEDATGNNQNHWHRSNKLYGRGSESSRA